MVKATLVRSVWSLEGSGHLEDFRVDNGTDNVYRILC
jgi:hypothetical protein